MAAADDYKKNRCIACRKDILGGARVVIQQGVGADGGGLHQECWARITTEPTWLLTVLAEVRRHLTDGECDTHERMTRCVQTIDRGTAYRG